MAMNDVVAQAQRAYERARLLRAAAVAAPSAALPAVSLWLGTSLASALTLGVALFVALFVMVWRGQGLSFAALSGGKAGLVPLALAHASKSFGHVCTPTGCTTLCVPACALGGVVAGALVERWARQSRRPWLTRAAGATVAGLVGALGCSCVGAGGILALVVGMTGSLFAARVVPRWV